MTKPLFTIHGSGGRFPCINYCMPDIDTILNKMGITNRIRCCGGMSIPAPIMYGTAVNVPGMLGIPQIYSDCPNYLNGTYSPLGNAMYTPANFVDPFSLPFVQNILNYGTGGGIAPWMNPSLSMPTFSPSGSAQNPFLPQNDSGVMQLLPIMLMMKELDKLAKKIDNIDKDESSQEEDTPSGRTSRHQSRETTLDCYDSDIDIDNGEGSTSSVRPGKPKKPAKTVKPTGSGDSGKPIVSNPENPTPKPIKEEVVIDANKLSSEELKRYNDLRTNVENIQNNITELETKQKGINDAINKLEAEVGKLKEDLNQAKISDSDAGIEFQDAAAALREAPQDKKAELEKKRNLANDKYLETRKKVEEISNQIKAKNDEIKTKKLELEGSDDKKGINSQLEDARKQLEQAETSLTEFTTAHGSKVKSSSSKPTQNPKTTDNKPDATDDTDDNINLEQINKCKRLLTRECSGYSADALIGTDGLLTKLSNSELKTLISSINFETNDTNWGPIERSLNDADEARKVEKYIAERLIKDRQEHLRSKDLPLIRYRGESSWKNDPIDRLMSPSRFAGYISKADPENLSDDADFYVTHSFSGDTDILTRIRKYSGALWGWGWDSGRDERMGYKNLITLLAKSNYSE